MKLARFLLEAREEFLEQVSYYEEQQKGLRDRFRESVEAATALASAHPKLGSLGSCEHGEYLPRAFRSRLCTAQNPTHWSSLQSPTSSFGQPIGGAASDA